MLLVQQWRGGYELFVVLCYWSWVEERGVQFEEGKGSTVSLFQAFAFS